MQINRSKLPILPRLIMILILMVGLLGFLPAGNALAAGTIIYVNAAASGANNGTSWATAYTNLQSAISAAASDDQIWVAAGTYYPTVGTDRTATFTLKNGVSIYGGFAGTETLVTQRDPKANVTILSGDIGTLGNSNDNSFHVVTGSSTDSTAVMDGFTITGGNAIADFITPWGGGMFNHIGNPTLANLVFNGNQASYGGGLYNYTSSPSMTNITFINNSADRAGGAYNTVNSNPLMTNITFTNNTATVRGGGMTVAQSSPTLRNVTFSGNTATYGGGLHNAYDGNPTMEHVTISGNVASQGGAIFNEQSSPVITNSIIYNNVGGGIFDDTSTPVVTYSIVTGGYPGTGNINANPLLGPLQENGGYTKTMALGEGSPAIDAANDSNCPGIDQRGVSRPQGLHCDMGAYELDNVPPDTTIDSKPPDPDGDRTPTFTFSGDDGGGVGVGSFMCQMDGGGYSLCTSPFTSLALSAGIHTFDVYAVDTDSNADPTPASYSWTLVFVPTQVVSILRADASPTSFTNVDFTVTFSATVTGVDENDFTLSTSGVSGASITGVSGSDDIYTVSVNTGTGDGTIGLNIQNQASMVDSYGNPPENLPYTGDETYSIIKIGTFEDVPNDHWAWRYIEGLYNAGITSGCNPSPLNYCPNTTVTRDQMAVFLLKAKYGSGYIPPDPVGMFLDVPVSNPYARWIEKLAQDGITSGCGSGNYCPTTPVTRDQMAVFLLKAKYGSGYVPPDPVGMFLDVPVNNPYARWIEKLAQDGITSGCGSGNYCPTTPVTRDQMAVFLDKTFNIPPLP